MTGSLCMKDKLKQHLLLININHIIWNKQEKEQQMETSLGTLLMLLFLLLVSAIS